MDFGSRARKTSQNYVAYMTHNGKEFAQSSKEPRSDAEESGACTPPLWKSISPMSGPEHFHDPYQSLSPPSRTQAIVQGQMELMAMVRNMPESYYELSLRDLVEKPASKSQGEDGSAGRGNDDPNEEKPLDRRENREKRQNSRKSAYLDRKAQMENSVSIGNGGGFLLKLVFPVSSLESRQKQRNSSSLAANSRTKVSPRPSLSDGPGKGLDKDWWKRFSASGKVEHGILDVDSGGMKRSGNSRKKTKNHRKRRAGAIGCWSFFLKKKGTSRK